MYTNICNKYIYELLNYKKKNVLAKLFEQKIFILYAYSFISVVYSVYNNPFTNKMYDSLWALT